MRARAGMTIALSVLVCLFLDSVLFDKLNLWDIRPDMVIALAVALGILIGGTRAGIICGSIGLLWDILFYKMLGVNAAIYLVSGVICGTFFRKYYADNALIPALLGASLSFVKDNVLAIIAALGGARIGYGFMLISYILPCAVFTGVMCIPLYFVLKPMLARYSKYLSEKRDDRV